MNKNTAQATPSILATYGLQASVCQYSGVPIVIACNFQHAPRLAGALNLRIHPIFNVPLVELLKAVRSTLQAGLPTEQHLLALALAYKAGFWNFRSPLHCQADKAEKLLALVAETVQAAIASPVYIDREAATGKKAQAKYPQLTVNTDTSCAVLIDYLHLVKDQLSTRAPMTAEEKLDWELELEAELNSVLQGGKGYRATYGRNAVQALKDAWVRDLVGECDWKLVEFCLNPEKDPKVTQLQEAIDLLTDFYPERDEFERAEGLQVIRFLERRIEVIRKEEQDYGFVTIVQTPGAGTGQLGANYTVRTQAVVTEAAKPISKDLRAEVEAEWKRQGKTNYTQLQLMMETKKRQKALEAAATQEGV